MFCFSSPRYQTMITVVKPSPVFFQLCIMQENLEKLNAALFPFKSIIGGKYIFKKVMILNKMKILLIYYKSSYFLNCKSFYYCLQSNQ